LEESVSGIKGRGNTSSLNLKHDSKRSVSAAYTYPKGEIVWIDYYDKDHNLRYILTSKEMRDFYFLYELKEGKFIKLGKDRSPWELERKFVKL
jgi:hypothetical protein